MDGGGDFTPHVVVSTRMKVQVDRTWLDRENILRDIKLNQQTMCVNFGLLLWKNLVHVYICLYEE